MRSRTCSFGHAYLSAHESCGEIADCRKEACTLLYTAIPSGETLSPNSSTGSSAGSRHGRVVQAHHKLSHIH
ncbi:unnamed protein product [Protopolystoma xenopodis]|uniref:Uncharacterized protein n=1 Tax=Protopolystoma xenopodis TaxID=117903 RepID=A0A448XFM1_9PLAT|nr:unnamed protein product [Protopolystoma xenopodis]